MVIEKLSKLWVDYGGIRVNHLIKFFILFSLSGSIIILINDLGEYSAASLQGYSSAITVNYGVRWPCKAGPCFTESNHDYPCFQMHEMKKKYFSEIENNSSFPAKNQYGKLLQEVQIKSPFPAKNQYEKLLKEVHIKSAIIRGSALLSVLLLSTICFFLILFNSFKPGFLLYLNSVIAFYWVMEPCKFCLNLFFNSYQSHEFFIAQDLNLSYLFILLILSTIGTVVCSYIFFFRIPKSLRISFLLAFILGFPFGFLIWFKFIGLLFFKANI